MFAHSLVVDTLLCNPSQSAQTPEWFEDQRGHFKQNDKEKDQ